MFQTKSRPTPASYDDDEKPAPKPRARATSAVTWKAIDQLVDALGDSIGKVIADERRQTLAVIESLQRRVLELESKAIRYQGVWRAEKRYQEGAAVTHAGGLWIANSSSHGDRPGKGAPHWRLAVKSGSAK